jgi:hypothetical protein
MLSINLNKKIPESKAKALTIIWKQKQKQTRGVCNPYTKTAFPERTENGGVTEKPYE